jgi:hypothetical protein
MDRNAAVHYHRIAAEACNALALLIGAAALTYHLVGDYRASRVLHQLRLEARVADVHRITTDDFDADGWGPDYRVEFIDGTVAYFLHRGYTAHVRTAPGADSGTRPTTPRAYIASESSRVDYHAPQYEQREF